MKTIISASRRTDVPRWYINDAINALNAENIVLVNPYNNTPYSISLKRQDIHSIVWWSKDYGEWLKRIDFFKNYNNFFQFTINGYSDEEIQNVLEPGITSSLEDRLEQARTIAKEFSPDQINWRMDPIVFWEKNGNRFHNLHDVNYISSFMSSIGITRCIISFIHLYKSVKKRAAKQEMTYKELSLQKKIQVAKKISVINKRNNIGTFSCANDDIVDGKYIKKSHCIDGELLEKLFGSKATRAMDKSQRESCGCVKSLDIGNYKQVCKHKCIYCYGRD